MANIANTMIITDEALSQISRRLIDKGTYNPNLINQVGDPQVINGIGYNFSETSYFTKNGITLSDNYNETTIKFKGTLGDFKESGNAIQPVYAFKLGDLALQFTNTTCKLMKNNTVIVQITSLNLNEGDEITTDITYTQTSVTLNLMVNLTTFETSGSLSSPQTMSSYTTAYIGTNGPNSELYWRGSIDLESFVIGQDDTEVYSPTSRPTIEFTEILVADEEYTLTSESTPITDHILSFPVTEIARTNNNILITATIGEDTYIFINEIGLYCTFGDGSTHLFSKLGNIKLEKTTDVGYNIIIHLNLDINVVNTVMFPEIIMKHAEYPKLSEFQTVQQVYAYATENLERMIKTNALGIGNYRNGLSLDIEGNEFLPVRPLGISESATDSTMSERKPVGVGYNKAQVYCRRNDELDVWKDNFNATFAYSLLSNWIKPKATIRKVFLPNLIASYGDTTMDENGGATVRPEILISYDEPTYSMVGNSDGYTMTNDQFNSNNNGIYVNAVEHSLNPSSVSHISPLGFSSMDVTNWDFFVGFETPENVTEAASVLNFATETIYKPLRLTVENGYCNLKVQSIPMLEATTPYGTATFSGTEEMLDFNNTRYYKWVTSNPIPPNFHVDFVGNLTVNHAELSGFSENDYAIYPKVFDPTSNWTIQFNLTTEVVLNGTIFAFGKVTENGIRGVHCYMDNGKIKVALSSDGSTIEHTLISNTTLNVESNYIVQIIYNPNTNTYSLKINGTTDSSAVVPHAIYKDSRCLSAIGVNVTTNETTSPLHGSLLMTDFIITKGSDVFAAACDSNYVMFEEAGVQVASVPYDIEGYEFSPMQINRVYEDSVVNENLFAVTPSTTYYVKASYDNTTYTVSYSTDNETFTEVFNFDTIEGLTHIDQVNMGSEFDLSIGGYKNSYSGVLFLDLYKFNFFEYSDEGELLNERHYKFYEEVITYSEGLQDYFHFTPYAYSAFRVNNLGEDKEFSKIQVLENFFRGGDDRINFGLDRGFSLCVKVNLKDASDKIILAKGDLETGEFYFVLKEEDTKLVFEFYTSDGNIFKLEKSIIPEEFDSYFNRPIILTITCDGHASPTFTLYKNGNVIASGQAPYTSALQASEAYLTNVTDIEEAADAVNTINDIIGIEGILTLQNYYYISTLLGTNF